MAIASHNHDVLKILQKLERDFLKLHAMVKIVDESGNVDFKYKLKDVAKNEETQSEALPIARKLGMPEEILAYALHAKDRIKQKLTRDGAALSLSQQPAGQSA
jgi:hypothetical protein